MDSKKKIIRKIVMSRRLLKLSRLVKETTLCSDILLQLQKKRLHLLEQLSILYSVKISLMSEARLSRKTEGTRSFWETDCQLADEATFKNNFRMNRRQFYKLSKLLKGLRKADTNMREAIPLEKRIAIALYVLGSSEGYRTIADMFGVGKSTVCKILLSFCAEVWRVLAPIYLNNFPLSKEKIKDLVQGFEAIGFPQCMGALDTCHIEILPSNEDATDYFNYKGWYSVVLLALVDAKCRFIYVSSGSPGRYKDSQIFQSSSLKQQLDECVLLSDLKKEISNVEVPVFITGDTAFRLSDKLMKPYAFEISLSNQQKYFDYSLSKSRRVVKNAFEHMKARFMRIGKRTDNAIKNANAIILSCCVLHNFLIENNDIINENWLQDLQIVESNRSYPEYVVSTIDHANSSERIRNAIALYLSRFDDDGRDEAAGIGSDCSGQATAMDGDNSSEAVDMSGDDGGDDSGEAADSSGDGDGTGDESSGIEFIVP